MMNHWLCKLERCVFNMQLFFFFFIISSSQPSVCGKRPQMECNSAEGQKAKLSSLVQQILQQLFGSCIVREFCLLQSAQLGVTLSRLSNEYAGLLPQDEICRIVKFITRLYQVLRLGMIGSLPPLSHTYSWHAAGQMQHCLRSSDVERLTFTTE